MTASRVTSPLEVKVKWYVGKENKKNEHTEDIIYNNDMNVHKLLNLYLTKQKTKRKKYRLVFNNTTLSSLITSIIVRLLFTNYTIDKYK